MYKKTNITQSSFLSFNQPIGLQMNPNNRWIKLADQVPWNEFEEKYAQLFPSETGNVAKPLRLALGSLIIQTRYKYADEELVSQIQENPYYQFFVGLPGYQDEPPFEASSLVHFRKRISLDIIMEVNDYLIEKQQSKDDDSHNNPPSGGETSSENTSSVDHPNKGTLMLDATCAPSYIKFPQDFELLSNARELLEKMLDRFCAEYPLSKPRMRRFEARKNYLALAKTKKRKYNKIRKTIRKQLSYVKRDLGFLENFMTLGYAPNKKETQMLQTIYKLYEQQDYMYKNKVHSVEKRIVSLSQPFIRPIVRGKLKAAVEFGAKLDLSIAEGGYARIERISFEAYNECTSLKDAVERYYERNSCYPERVLADQIYRNRENINYCKDHDIRLSGPKLGRPSATVKADKKTEYRDNVDRIEVERAFSLAKRNYGLGVIRTRLEETSLTSIALSIFTMNLFRASLRSFLRFCSQRLKKRLKFLVAHCEYLSECFEMSVRKSLLQC